jgi:signal transduction histidine kinase
MPDRIENFAEQLKQTTKLTGAHWAAWIKREEKEWDLFLHTSMSKSRQIHLYNFLHLRESAAWLGGALGSGHVRFKNCVGFAEKIGCSRIYIFPNPQVQSILLVGADQLSKEAQSFFRIISLTCPIGSIDEFKPVYKEAMQLTTNLSREVSFEPQVVFKWLLDILSNIVGCNAAYLAIRLGKVFRIVAIMNYAETILGYEIPIDDNELDGLVVDRRVSPIPESPELPICVMQEALSKKIRSYYSMPILLRRMLIGKFVFVSYDLHGFNSSVIYRAKAQLEWIAHAVEMTIVFSEVSHYLQQFALLTELSSSVASGANPDEAARRLVIRLRRTFDTNLVKVLLLTQDEKRLREYGDESQTAPFMVPIETSLVGYVIQTGKPVRVGDVKEAPRYLVYDPEVKSALCVPLIYRSKPIGVISIESTGSNAFTLQDEQLLLVIGSHLASMFENVRRNQELRATIQENIRLYDELRSYVDKIEKTQYAMIQAEKMAAAGRLTASIAHEINNPLQSVHNCLHLAGRKELSLVDRQKYLDMAQNELNRLMLIVQRMLDFYRPGAKDRKPTNINEMISKILSLLEQQLVKEGVVIHQDLLENLPLVMVVANQIQQVFLNLIVNSVEAMPQGGEIWIKTDSYLSDGEEWIEVFIEDSGSGIPEINRERIFEPFVSTKENGTGLGLSVSYGIIATHAGFINLTDGSHGNGACFRIVLPKEEKV